MKRILLVLTAAALVAAMVGATAVPAFAAGGGTPGGGTPDECKFAEAPIIFDCRGGHGNGKFVEEGGSLVDPGGGGGKTYFDRATGENTRSSGRGGGGSEP